MKRFNQIVRWALVVLWMVLIFYLSHQVADDSAGLSGDLTEIIIGNIEKITSVDVDSDLFHHLVRKNAHFFAYFILSVLTLNALKWSGVTGTRWMGMAFLICVLYAVTDEVHQLFIPGRSGELKDIFIDSAGALVGIFVYAGIGRLIKKIKINIIY